MDAGSSTAAGLLAISGSSGTRLRTAGIAGGNVNQKLYGGGAQPANGVPRILSRVDLIRLGDADTGAGLAQNDGF